MAAVSATSWWLLLAVSTIYVTASAAARLMCRRVRRRGALPVLSRSSYPGVARLVQPLSAFPKLILFATAVTPCVLLIAGQPFPEIVFWTLAVPGWGGFCVLVLFWAIALPLAWLRHRRLSGERVREADQRGDPEAAYRIGVGLYEADPEAAEAAWRRADERGHPRAPAAIGYLLQARGDDEAAQAAYCRADQRGDATGAFNLGLLLERQGDRDGAEAAFERAEGRGHPDALAQLDRLQADPDDLLDAEHQRALKAQSMRRGSITTAVILVLAVCLLAARGAPPEAFGVAVLAAVALDFLLTLAFGIVSVSIALHRKPPGGPQTQP